MVKSGKLAFMILLGALVSSVFVSLCSARGSTASLTSSIANDARPDVAIMEDGRWGSFTLVRSSEKHQIRLTTGWLNSVETKSKEVCTAPPGVVRLMHADTFTEEWHVGAVVRRVKTQETSYFTPDFLIKDRSGYQKKKTGIKMVSVRDAAVFDTYGHKAMMLISENGSSSSDRQNKLWLRGVDGSMLLIDNSIDPIAFPSGDFDRAGRLHAVWKRGGTIRYAVLDCSQEPYRIMHRPRNIGLAAANYGIFNFKPKPYVDDLGPSIAVGHGKVFIAWSMPLAPLFSPPRSSLRLARVSEDKEKGYRVDFVQTLQGFSRLAYHPDIALDKKGDLGILWEELPGRNFEIFYRQINNFTDTAGPIARVTRDYPNSRFPRITAVDDGFQALWKGLGSEIDTICTRFVDEKAIEAGDEKSTLGVYSWNQKLMEYVFRLATLVLLSAGNVVRAFPALLIAVFCAVRLTAKLNPAKDRAPLKVTLLFGCSLLHGIKLLAPVLYGGGYSNVILSTAGTVLATAVLIGITTRERHSWDELKWFGYLSVWVFIDRAAALAPHIQDFFLR